MTENVAVAERHAWVSVPEDCDYCNYDVHRCHFCGQDLDHEGWEPGGLIEHTTEYCRPDLFDHEPGATCTWPLTGIPELDAELRRPGCYWDHENGELRG